MDKRIKILIGVVICICLGTLHYCSVKHAEEDAYAEGYDDGKKKGHEEGYDEGLKKGYDEGLAAGQSSGYRRGYSSGYSSGQRATVPCSMCQGRGVNACFHCQGQGCGMCSNTGVDKCFHCDGRGFNYM